MEVNYMKRKMNRRGFTLIELLAVIIILAILMTLAITAMSSYITNARKDTFITTAQSYAASARLSFVNGDYPEIGRGQCIAVRTSSIPLESGSEDSPFGRAYEDNDSYVVIRNVTAAGSSEDDKYEYYVQMVDEQGNHFGLMREADVERNNVILRDVTTAPKPSGSYQTLPASVSEASPETLNLYKGGVAGTADGTCSLIQIIG